MLLVYELWDPDSRLSWMACEDRQALQAPLYAQTPHLALQMGSRLRG